MTIIDVEKLFGNDSGEMDDNLEDYFVETPEYVRITGGNIFLVAGKRGTGKSSIAKIIAQKTKYSIIIRPTNLEIDTIREEALRATEGIFEPKLTKVWINAIYGEIAKHIFRSCSKETYSNTKYLSKYINFISDEGTGEEMKFLDTFLKYSKLLTTDVDNTSSSNRELFNNPQIEALDREIQTCLKRSDEKFFILFDNLDDDYDLNPAFTSVLVDTLINAGIQVMRQSKFVRPVVFIRNDILSFIANSRNSAVAQMRSNKVELIWTTEKLLSVLNNRFSNYFGGNKPKPGTESHNSMYLKKVFTEYYTYFGRQGVEIKKPIGLYFTERSLMRPREIIQFCRKVIEINNYKIPITSKEVQESEPRFVAEFMDDLCAEYKNLYPNLREILELFRKGRYPNKKDGWNWSVSELRDLFEKNVYLTNYRNDSMNFSNAVNVLFQVGFLRAVSKIVRPGRRIERKYVTSIENSDFPTDNVDEFDVHRLFRSQLKFEKRS